MTIAEALDLLDTVLQDRQLNNTQAHVFRQSWLGLTYTQIAEELNYTAEYVRSVGAELWKLLSETFGEGITKQNVKTVLERWARYNAQPRAVGQRSSGTAQYFIADRHGVNLEMVLIPPGIFEMGTPEGEAGSSDNERPQRIVTLAQFFMGKYPVTQAQWRGVAHLPAINQKLKPSPSGFKGDDTLPVECVSWHEAVEFCDRLSRHTQRTYRLPSEAEWEYACRAAPMPTSGTPGIGKVRRAGTQTPFHFGKTISPQYANYDGTQVYGDHGFKGEYRQKTTPVGHFGVANRFGLYDMHGNVWEWCADHWHKNYHDAPTDGRAWITGGDSDYRALRGGSWDSYPENCRSAFRGCNNPDLANYNYGFRVVSSASSTLH